MSFFTIKRTRQDGYSGSKSHVHIDKLLNDRSKTLKIVTPYLGMHYAKMLLGLAKRKKIHLIVSGDERSREPAVKMLMKNKRIIGKSAIIYFIAVMAFAWLLKAYAITLALGILFVFLLLVDIFHKPLGSPVKMKIVKEKFIHEKLYISEKMAIVGSANLTYSGTHKNIEHIEIIDDKSKINELSRHFDELWNRY